MDTPTQDLPVRRGAKGIYPWREWFDGKPHTVKQGTDFHSDLRAFRNAIYAAAHRRGFKSHVATDWDNRTLTFYVDRENKQ